MCLYKGVLSYLFFFKSVKICLCSLLLGNYVFETIGLSHFGCILDSFTNSPTMTSIYATIFKNLNVGLHPKMSHLDPHINQCELECIW